MHFPEITFPYEHSARSSDTFDFKRQGSGDGNVFQVQINEELIFACEINLLTIIEVTDNVARDLDIN